MSDQIFVILYVGISIAICLLGYTFGIFSEKSRSFLSRDGVITVAVNDKIYRVDAQFGIELTFTRVCGWQLWLTEGRKIEDYVLLGCDRQNCDFEIVINGVVAVSKKKV